MKKNMWNFFLIVSLVTLFMSCDKDEDNKDDEKPALEVQTGAIVTNCGNIAITTFSVINNTLSKIEEQGVLYGKENKLNIASSSKINVALEENTSEKILIEGLEPGTVYYYCSFAKCNGEIYFGETEHFTASSQVWEREADYVTDFNSEECIRDFTTIKLAGEGRAWYVVPVKVSGLPDYLLASSSVDIASSFASQITQTKDADNILQYAADFTGKILPGVSLYVIDVDGFLVGANRNSSIDVLVSSTPISNLAEADAAEKIGSIQFIPKQWQASQEFLLPAKYYDTKCYIAIRNKAVFETGIGVLLGEFEITSLVDPNK